MTDLHTRDQRTYEQLLADAVRVLTEAARRTITWTYPDGIEHREQAAWAEFVTHALAGAAANIGGIEAILAGRPGCWEADKVRDLLCATVGHDEQYLLAHRTEAVVVRVHVGDILHGLGVRTLYDEAHDELERRADLIWARYRVPGSEDVVSLPTPEDQAELVDLARLHEALDTQRARECAAYGEAFRANVLQAATELFPNLPVPVDLIADLDWRGDLGPDHEWDGPQWRLWETARRNTPLPGSSIPLADYPPGADIAQLEREAGRTPLARLNQEEGRP
jgi:hypothetical protein